MILLLLRCYILVDLFNTSRLPFARVEESRGSVRRLLVSLRLGVGPFWQPLGSHILSHLLLSFLRNGIRLFHCARLCHLSFINEKGTLVSSTGLDDHLIIGTGHSGGKSRNLRNYL